MSKYKVLYIDDDPSEVRDVIRSLERTGELEVESFVVKNGTIFSELSAILDEGNFDYLLIDYMLNEKTGWGKDGNEVLEWFLDRYPHFPAIVVTSDEMKALQEVDNIDAEKIRSKSDYDKDGDDSFITRIASRIKRYHMKIEEYEEALLDLKKISDERELTADEAQDYIKKDRFLQEILGANVLNIPSDVIYQDGNKLSELLKETEELIELIKADEAVS